MSVNVTGLICVLLLPWNFKQVERFDFFLSVRTFNLSVSVTHWFRITPLTEPFQPTSRKFTSKTHQFISQFCISIAFPLQAHSAKIQQTHCSKITSECVFWPLCSSLSLPTLTPSPEVQATWLFFEGCDLFYSHHFLFQCWKVNSCVCSSMRSAYIKQASLSFRPSGKVSHPRE